MLEAVLLLLGIGALALVLIAFWGASIWPHQARRDFLKLLDEYKLDEILLELDTPGVTLLHCPPNWQCIFSDNVAVAHRRLDVL
ncbi:hypothetical protein CT676_09435 [Bradyrhizobium sp. MOS001]|uniref:hypothetical protein n=1 Tax=Bradyrhizobium sp. MOS001 TaxID=2133948 RepID=UPI001074E391|nr:hypothetical protein [Bradyrhizobium sp. MOS001]TFW61100.1 hypothetical protein CT676_09435 [Bradyrhizobium sp. MOS001]